MWHYATSIRCSVRLLTTFHRNPASKRKGGCGRELSHQKKRRLSRQSHHGLTFPIQPAGSVARATIEMQFQCGHPTLQGGCTSTVTHHRKRGPSVHQSNSSEKKETPKCNRLLVLDDLEVNFTDNQSECVMDVNSGFYSYWHPERYATY